MGNLFGFVDPEDDECLIITDSFITPCKGGAHSAIMDPRTGGYRDEYAEVYKLTNPNVMQIGWYHSHPFEPIDEEKEGKFSCKHHHCWFSSTDVTSQTNGQGLKDKYGVPYVGIVVDPQTTMKRRKIHFGCFRVYNRIASDDERRKMKGGVVVPKGRTPDGKSLAHFGDSANFARWGDQWDKYYALDVSFYTNEQNRKTLKMLNASYGWIDSLVLKGTTDVCERVTQRAMRRFPVNANAAMRRMTNGQFTFVDKPIAFKRSEPGSHSPDRRKRTQRRDQRHSTRDDLDKSYLNVCKALQDASVLRATDQVKSITNILSTEP